LVRLSVEAAIELLRLEPQKFRLLYYNTSTTQPENEEDLLLVEAERLYAKMLENITNRVVTSLSDNISSVSASVQKEMCEEQAFHPNFDASENDSDNTTNALCDNTVSRLQDDGNDADVLR
jgi:hypothetical protein